MSQRSEFESSSSQTAPWPEYEPTVAAVFEKYGPKTYRFINIEDWPDEIQIDNAVLSSMTNGTAVARLDRDAVPQRINATAIVQPADYTIPINRPPLAGIDDLETLTSVGELIYELFDLITFIITSPTIELTNRRKIAEIVQELHETHNYPLPDIKQQLISLAQQRGDLPSGD